MEGAQKFLELTLPGAEYMSAGVLNVLEEWRDKRVQGDDGSIFTFEVSLTGRAAIRKYAVVANCEQSTLYDWSKAQLTLRTFSRGRLVDTKITEPPSTGDNKFNFGSMADAKAYGSVVQLRWKDQPGTSTVYLANDDLAARVAYAYEFLRLKCDPTTATGF